MENPMPLEFQSLTMMDLRSSPGEVLDRVSKNNEAFLIERNGQQLACLVPVSVFLPDIRRSTLNSELAQLHQQGESPRAVIAPEKGVQLYFKEGVAGKEYTIEIVLPHKYPVVAPKAYITPVKEGAPHRWQDGALCIFGAVANWNPGKHDVGFVLKLARKWLAGYNEWEKTGRWSSKATEASE
jgi:hypothetical protein